MMGRVVRTFQHSYMHTIRGPPVTSLSKANPWNTDKYLMYVCHILSLHLLRSKVGNSASITWRMLGDLVVACYFHPVSSLFHA
ncbi:hypothetical protein QR685DRAFT_294989 [Neurospora intermedia]|uniref:Uncharacterized protein n=1 Tax=Neurospora intermedia TaxID=5142 RepID=A0ABR3DAM4_NEUIN